MSMITGCPACGTLFRVVPDQLKISEGWVRCGHCGEVFDASASLRPEADAATAPAPLASSASAAASTSPSQAQDLSPGAAELPPPRTEEKPPAPHPAAAADPIELGPPGIAPLEVPPAGIEPVPVAPMFVRAEAATIPAELPSAAPQPAAAAATGDSQFTVSHGFADAEFPADALTPDEEEALVPPTAGRKPAAASSADEDERDAAAAPLSRAFAPSTHAVDDAYPDDLSFVQQARRQAFWRSPAVRAVTVLAVLLLAGLLVAQYAVHHRHRIAAQSPDWRPWLERLCMPVGCTLGPLQRIESVVIENSGFARVRPDAYRLTVSLRNTSETPVALPALQLTLTDSQEQPVVQRVFTPAELGATTDTIAPASEFTASLVLGVNPGPSAGRISGYRLLAFYP